MAGHSRQANIISHGICLDGIGGQPGEETGEPPVLVATDAPCAECGHSHDFEACPQCGAWITIGYGLMFGGMGLYKFCNNETCDWFWKREDDE